MKLMYITWNDHAVLTSFNHMHACKVHLTLPAFGVQLTISAAVACDWLLLLADHIKQSSSCILTGSLVSLQFPEQTAQQLPVTFWFVSHFLSQKSVCFRKFRQQ